MPERTAKARRAACWLPTAFEKLDAGLYADTWTVFQLEDEAKGLWGYLHCDLSDRMMIAFCEDRGWQDQDSNSPEFEGIKGVESATFNQEQEADGVEWELGSEFARVSGVITAWVHRDNDTWYWEVNDDARGRIRDSGGCHTREEARRQAVEAARGMNNEE